MKKILFFIFFIASVIIAHAQSTSTYWNLTGNTGINDYNFIGTTGTEDCANLIFKTRNIKRMELSPIGTFLGLGSYPDEATLRIHYQLDTGGKPPCEDLPFSDPIYSRKLIHLTTPETGLYPNKGFFIAYSYQKELFFKQQEQANFNIEGPGGGLTITPNGDIGVGTDVPYQKLHIVDGNILISKTSTRAPKSPNGSILFGADIDNKFPMGRWGIEYLNGEDDCYGLNFWRPWNPGGGGSSNYTLFLSNNDKVGIGTKNPLTKFQIGNIWTFHDGANDKIIGRNTYYNGTNNVRITSGVASRIYFGSGGDIVLQTTPTGSAGSTISTWNTVMMKNDGNVGIGVTNPTVKLDVLGTIRAHEVKVCLNQGCDYVFADDYELMSLKDLNAFIKTNKHLPDVAPAAEMEAEGINLSEMNALLLRKIEELTLYIIGQEEQMKKLEKRLSDVEDKKGGE